MQVAPSTMVYAKGGYTNLAVEANYEGPDDTFEFDDNADGFRVGAGVEQLFGPNAYGKLEYRYSNYSNLEHNREGTTDLSRNIDLDRHQVVRSEEHTSELQSLMRTSYAVFCLKKNKQTTKD